MSFLFSLIILLLSAVWSLTALIAEGTTCQEDIVNHAVDLCTKY